MMLQLLANAHVHAPTDLGIRNLVIGGERILGFVNDPDDVSAPGMEVFDLEGRPVIPGLIDGHAHITGGGGEDGFATRVPTVPLSRFTRAGVTSVVGVLGTDDTTRSTRGLVAQAGALNEEGLSAWCHTGGYHVPPVTLTGSVRDDIVFVGPIIGVGELAISDHRSSQPTLDELLRIASDAHVAGLITRKAGIVHLHLGDGERGLALVHDAIRTTELPARVFNPTHVNRRAALFDEALDLARRGCYVDVTAFPVGEDDPAIAAPDAILRYLEAGCPADRITVSSDGGGCLPVFNAEGELVAMDIGTPAGLPETLRALLDAGLPLDAALPAFTSNAARLLRLRGKGRIEPGMDADLVILGEGGRIEGVIARGRWHVRDGSPRILGKFEQQY
jgi:beta-aspartyl-dipeptidase (metallo-type)